MKAKGTGSHEQASTLKSLKRLELPSISSRRRPSG